MASGANFQHIRIMLQDNRSPVGVMLLGVANGLCETSVFLCEPETFIYFEMRVRDFGVIVEMRVRDLCS